METKGEEYYVSNVDTGRNIDTPMYPWLILFLYKKVSEMNFFNRMNNLYLNERHFFKLIILTLMILSASLYTILPETILLWTNLVIQNCLSLLTPILLYSNVYVWVGLVMKHLHVFFSMKACVASCIILELFLEILSNFFSINIKTESALTLTILTLMFGIGMSTSGTLFENMNNIGTLLVVNSIIVVRLMIIPSTTSFGGWFDFLKPIFVYLYIISGLALSTWPAFTIFSKKETSRSFARHLQGEMNSIPVIRSRRASSIEMKSSHMQNGILQNKTRRKSLPALGGAPSARKISMSSMDLTILGEAHGMITDLLADTSLPLNVTGTLRIVADMISPLLQHSLHRQGAPLLTVLEKTKNNEDQEQVQNQPDLKDDTPLSLKQRLQRNLGVSSRRMSSSYTTTTSATGMPTIDMEYHHKKNANKTSTNSTSSPTAIKKTSSRSKSYAGALTPAERSNLLKSHSRSFSQSTSPTQSGLLRKELATSDDTIFKVEIERGKPIFFEGMDASESENETNESTDEESVKDIVSLNGCASNNNNNNNINRTKFVLDERLEDVKETPEKDVVNNTDQDTKTTLETVENEVLTEVTPSADLPSSLPDNVEDNVEMTSEDTLPFQMDDDKPTESTSAPKRGLRKMSDTSRTLRSNSTGSVKNELKSSDSSDNLIIPATNQMRRKSSRELHMEYEIAISRDIDEMLSKVREWDFPIFELSEKCNVLTQLAFRIFQLCDFFKTFKIAEVTFLKFFRALESGYHNIPYHNRIHAADVLHGVYYLTQHRIPGFNSEPFRSPSLANSENKATPSSSPQENDEIVIKKDTKYDYGCICDSVPDLELMALYVAAAMHDFDHPGRTNAFLVATLNSKALLYNDRSVLESHHAAASWSLLVTNPGLNFLSTLDAADFKRFRFIVIEQILSTDLKKHFDFLTEWNAKISDQGGGLNFSSEADRLLLGQMAIKIADISGPSKEWDLHYRWTERIIEEFYQQGEDERTLGMPTSAYMDRGNPQVPQLQASFIKHLVQPLYIAYEKAGILPGEWVDMEEGEQDEDVSDSDASGEEVDQDTTPKGGEKTKSAMNGPTTTINTDNDNEDVKDVSTDETDSSADYIEEGDDKKAAIFCVMSDNIKRNYEKWLRIIEEEKEQNGETEETETDDT